MRFTGSLLIVVAAILAAPPAYPSGTAFSLARETFVRAVDGNGAAVEEAVRRFEHLTATGGAAAPLYQAYLGAAQTMQGRDAWLPWNKLRATEKGLATVEKALRRLDARPDPADGNVIALETRLVAITTYLAIPAFFNRTDSARQLLREAFAHPAFATAPGDVRAALYRQVAVLAVRDGKPAEEGEYLRKTAAPDAGVRP